MTEELERHYANAQPDIQERLRALIEAAGGASSENADLYQDLLLSVVKLIGEEPDRWDVKIIANTVKELRRAFRVCRTYARRRKVTIFGSARATADSADYKLAVELGRRLAADGFMVITGAGPGIMHAGHEGAGAANSIGLNIRLPFEQTANPIIHRDPKLITFRFFFTRKLFFVKEADALVVFPGGFGTLDETFELVTLVQTGKSPVVPVLLIEAPGGGYWEAWARFVEEQLLGRKLISVSDLALFQRVHSAEECVAELERFYRNYHSSRYLAGKLLLRLRRPISQALLEGLNARYADILLSGTIEQSSFDPQEQDEPELGRMTRLCLHFNQRHHGRLRQLIDEINLEEPPA